MAFQSREGKQSGVCRACNSLRDSEGGCQCAVDIESLMQEAPEGRFTAADAFHNQAARSKKLEQQKPRDPESGLVGGAMKLGTGVVRQKPSRRDRNQNKAPGA